MTPGGTPGDGARPVRLSSIIDLVGGESRGAADPEIRGVAPLDRAGPADLSFVAAPKYLRYLGATRAAALLIAPALVDETDAFAGPRIVVADVHRALARVVESMYPPAEWEPGVDARATVSPEARIGEGCRIEAGAVIEAGATVGARCRIGAHSVVGGHCELGDDVLLHPHVVLYPHTRVGDRSVLHSGVRAGVDGFGYVFVDGEHRKVPQVGTCVIGADVEIGANTTIDRGSIGPTEIGDGAKIDNLVHIAHNVRIGPRAIIIAQVGIAGSTRVGAGAVLGGQAGIPGHVEIGAGAQIAAQAGVFGDVPPGETYSGYPARPHRESLRAQAALFRLPETLKKLRSRGEGRNG